MNPVVLSVVLGTLSVIAGLVDSSGELWTEPGVLVVEYGGSLRVKLRESCSPAESNFSGGMETSIRKQTLEKKPGEMELELLNVTEWNSNNYIYHSCNNTRTKKPIQVLVYGTPVLKVTPSPPDTWELECSVSGTAPLGNLSVTLRSDHDVLTAETLRGSGRSQPDTVQLTHRMPLRLQDNGKSVTCEALLDLSPHGPRFNVTSRPVVLNLTEFPEGPFMAAPQYLELEDSANVACSVRRDLREAHFTIAVANQSFPVTTSPDGHRATAEVTADRTGNVRLLCAVRVGGVERRAEATIHVYYVPEPQLNVANVTLVAGTNVTGVCVLPAAQSGDIQVRVRSGDRVLEGWGRPPLSFSVTVGEEDEELELSCEAELVGISKIPKRISSRIPVHAKPRLDEGSCPRWQNWTEGQNETLRCRARGHPKAEVICAKDGNSFPAGVWHRARCAHAGTFVCRATNALGTAERNVTLWVLSGPTQPPEDDSNLLLPVLLGVLLPVLALLAIAGGYYVYHHQTKIGEYWLWKRQPPAELKPLRAPGLSQKEAALNGSAPAAP